MTGKFRNTMSVFLMVILMIPLFIKIADSAFHEHDHFVCKAKQEHHFHEDHEKCPVCCFEFPLYLSQEVNQYRTPVETTDRYRDLYQSIRFAGFPKYSFLLRAPPVEC